MEQLAETLRSLWVLWLMGLFLGIVIWAVWPSNQSKMDRWGRIPLEVDEGEAADANKG